MKLCILQNLIDIIRRKYYDITYEKMRKTLEYLSDYYDIDAGIMHNIFKNHLFPQLTCGFDKKNLKKYIATLDPAKLPKAEGELRDYQIRVLNLAKELIPVIEGQDIHPILVGGTLLGAVRHKGFIPWDDDADFDLMRSDYEKLYEFAKNNYIFHEEYKYENYKDFFADLNNLLKENPNQIIFTMKTCGLCAYKGTSLRDVVSVDFFPRDYINDSLSEETYMKYINKSRKNKQFKYWYEYFDFIEKEMKDNVIFPKSSSKTAKGWGSYAINTLNRGVVINAEKMFPLRRIAFEDTEFYTVADPDNYLKVMYGKDYNSFPVCIDFAKTAIMLSEYADMCEETKNE